MSTLVVLLEREKGKEVSLLGQSGGMSLHSLVAAGPIDCLFKFG